MIAHEARLELDYLNLSFVLHLSLETRLEVNGRQCVRPHHVDNTPSRPIWQVKQRWAHLVLGSETAWESWVLWTFCFFCRHCSC